MQILAVTNLPIYLPSDVAHVPFGDPIGGVTCTSASPGVFTVPGYDAPAAGDLIAFTFTLPGGSIPTGITAATPYYVVSPSGATFSVSATKGGSAINTSSTGANLVAHLLSGEVDGVTLPFKPSNTVVVENNSGGTLVLQSTNDLNVSPAGSSSLSPTYPGGPNASNWATLLSLTSGQIGQCALNNDWIRVSTSGTLYLQQN